MEARKALGQEQPTAKRVLSALEEAVKRFLPDYRKLRLGVWDGEYLLINHGAMTLPVRLLSEGERGVLALVLDLTRRLSLANPNLRDSGCRI